MKIPNFLQSPQVYGTPGHKKCFCFTGNWVKQKHFGFVSIQLFFGPVGITYRFPFNLYHLLLHYTLLFLLLRDVSFQWNNCLKVARLRPGYKKHSWSFLPYTWKLAAFFSYPLAYTKCDMCETTTQRNVKFKVKCMKSQLKNLIGISCFIYRKAGLVVNWLLKPKLNIDRWKFPQCQ